MILANLLRGHTLLWLHHRHLLLLHGLLLLCLIRACSAVVIASELIVLALGGIKIGERHYDLSFEFYVELKAGDLCEEEEDAIDSGNLKADDRVELQVKKMALNQKRINRKVDLCKEV